MSSGFPGSRSGVRVQVTFITVGEFKRRRSGLWWVLTGVPVSLEGRLSQELEQNPPSNIVHQDRSRVPGAASLEGSVGLSPLSHSSGYKMYILYTVVENNFSTI